MRKYLFLGLLAISSFSFAWGGHYNSYKTSGHGRGFCSSYNYANPYRENIKLSSAQQKMFNNYQLQIDEKRLEMNKIMNSDTINWNRVEKLNKEIAEIRAKIKTEMMKVQYSA